jgi:hypothetical protein
MTGSDYLVLFDISRTPYWGWCFGLLGLGMSAGGLGFFFLGETKAKRAAGAYLVVAGMLGAIVFSGQALYDYLSLRRSYATGRYLAVEGVVQDFQRDYSTGKSPQTFTVGDRHFEIWAATWAPDFHHTVGFGGPNLSGRCVRILFIERLERYRIIWLGERRHGECLRDAEVGARK